MLALCVGESGKISPIDTNSLPERCQPIDIHKVPPRNATGWRAAR